MNQLKALDKSERPYEKCVMYGPESLSDGELLAILLRSGTKEHDVLELADRVLRLRPETDGLVGLMQHGIQDFLSIPGIGRTKAIQLTAVAELSKRISTRKKIRRDACFRSSAQVADFYMEELRHLPREEVRVMYLDNRLRLISDRLLFSGTGSSSVVSQREVLTEALRVGAMNLFIVHNHPGGDPTPSDEDVVFTRQLAGGAELIGLRLVDHIVIGDLVWFSFATQGLL